MQPHLDSSGSVSPSDTARPARRSIRIELSVRTLLLVTATVAAIWCVMHVLPALLVLVTAMMLVGALNPSVEWLQEHGVRRGFAIGLVFSTLAIVSVALLLLTVPPMLQQLETLANDEPQLREKLVSYLEKSQWTSTLANDLKNLRYEDLLKSSRTTLLTLTTRALEIVAFAIASVFLAVYVMLDRDRLRGALFSIVPRGHHLKLSRILIDLESIVGGYIRGQALTSGLMAVFIFLLLVVCHVPNPLPIAAFGGIMDLLPYIGIILTMAPAVLAAWAVSPGVAATVFVLLFAYEEFEGRILIPLVYGRALRLPSSVVFFALILGSALGGIIGALLALPAAAAVLMFIEDLHVPLPGEALQTEDILEERKEAETESEYERRARRLSAEKAAAVAVEISEERKEEEREAEKSAKP